MSIGDDCFDGAGDLMGGLLYPHCKSGSYNPKHFIDEKEYYFLEWNHMNIDFYIQLKYCYGIGGPCEYISINKKKFNKNPCDYISKYMIHHFPDNRYVKQCTDLNIKSEDNDNMSEQDYGDIIKFRFKEKNWYGQTITTDIDEPKYRKNPCEFLPKYFKNKGINHKFVRLCETD